jgi:hypothetical protein
MGMNLEKALEIVDVELPQMRPMALRRAMEAIRAELAVVQNLSHNSALEVSSEMHDFAVKHADSEPIHASAHIERWSRQLSNNKGV